MYAYLETKKIIVQWQKDLDLNLNTQEMEKNAEALIARIAQADILLYTAEEIDHGPTDTNP